MGTLKLSITENIDLTYGGYEYNYTTSGDSDDLEITDVNQKYIELKKLNVQILGRGVTWVDAGTFDSLLEASMLISSIQKRQGLLIGSPEEIAYKNNWISKDQLKIILDTMGKNSYSKYLYSLLD